jgi:hypothetical protein
VFNNFDATIGSLTFKSRNVKGAIRRSCEVTLETDFTAEIAAGIGKDAKRWRSDLKSLAIEQIKIPISAVAVMARFVTPDGDEHRVPQARGVNAIGVMPESEEDENPRIKIKLGFSLRSEDAAWLPMKLGELVEVVLTKVQLSLVDEPQAAAV